MKPTFIYCLWCPVKRRIRYIGKTVSPVSRLGVHLSDGRRGKHQYVSRWIGGLLKRGKAPRFRILYQVPNADDWRDHERRVIALCLAANRPLVNSTAGGEGYTMLTAEQRERHSQAARASYSPELRQRRSEKFKALWSDPEYRERVRKKLSVAARRPENRRRVAAMKRSPEGEARRIAAVKAYNAKPETKRLQAERIAARRGPDGRFA